MAHAHDHDHPHPPNGDTTPHAHDTGPLARALAFLGGHQHEASASAVLESSGQGIRAVRLSLLALLATAAFQVAIVALSGSVALLADTLHNVSDAFTAVPLWVAFALSRRAGDRHYTYGYGRAEDLAGLLIVGVVFAGAGFSAWESYRRLWHPSAPDHLGWVMLAALVGFAGNEAVALFRIRTGRRIGSAALVADGQHARADGLTSLAVLLGALGVLAGFERADPIVGLLITLVIVLIGRDAARAMWRRLMDAVEPEVLESIERAAEAAAGPGDVHAVRVRWLGHSLQAELHLTVDEDLSTGESHRLAEEVRHALFHAQPLLAGVSVHVDPCGHGGRDPHETIAHHLPDRERRRRERRRNA